MITVFKIFEKINVPEIGDYVLCDYKNSNNILKDFLKNNIGKIEKKINSYQLGIKTGEIYSKIKYDYVPLEIQNFFTNNFISPDDYYYTINIKNITDVAKTKEELELKIKAKKYNIL